MFECNAVIEKVSLTNDDHGLLSAWLHLSYGGGGQGFGGYALYLPKDFTHSKDKHGDICGHFIWRCLEVGGVTEWSSLVGKTIRVRKDNEWGSIISIGHIVKDDWFEPTKEFDELLK
jgi:hypothetical protein